MTTKILLFQLFYTTTFCPLSLGQLLWTSLHCGNLGGHHWDYCLIKFCKSQYEVYLMVWINLWEILTYSFCQQIIFTVQIKWDINLKSIDFDVIQNLLFCIDWWLIFVTFEINLKQMTYDLCLRFMCNRKVYWQYPEFWWLMTI